MKSQRLLLSGLVASLAACASTSSVTPPKESLEVLLSSERAQGQYAKNLSQRTSEAKEIVDYIVDTTNTLYVQPVLAAPLSLERETDVEENESYCAVGVAYRMEFDPLLTQGLKWVGINYCVQDSQITTNVQVQVSTQQSSSQERDLFLEYQEEEEGTRIFLPIPGLQEQLESRGFSSPSNRYSYTARQDVKVKLGKNKEGSFYVEVRDEDLLPYAEELLSQVARESELPALLNLGNLVRTVVGADEWFNSNIDVTSIRQKAKEEKHNKESLRVLDESLRALEQQFAQSIQTHDTYAPLLANLNLEPLFKQYPFLTTRSLDITRLNTSIQNPKVLNHTLRDIDSAVKPLPRSYQERLRTSPVYISGAHTDLNTLCDEEGVAACFDPETNRIYFIESSDYQLDTPHELAHAHFSSLPRSVQQEVIRSFSSFVQRNEVQEEVTKTKEGDFIWSSGSRDGPRYSCPRAYSARNEQEYMATYVEDVMGNKGEAVISLLKGKYRPDVVATLEVLTFWGFLGTSQEAKGYLAPIYQKAGLGNAAITKLKGNPK